MSCIRMSKVSSIRLEQTMLEIASQIDYYVRDEAVGRKEASGT